MLHCEKHFTQSFGEVFKLTPGANLVVELDGNAATSCVAVHHCDATCADITFYLIHLKQTYTGDCHVCGIFQLLVSIASQWSSWLNGSSRWLSLSAAQAPGLK